MTKAKILYVLFICLNTIILFGQQVDTVLVHNSIGPLKIVSTLDTIKSDKYHNEYVLRISINSLKNTDFIQEIIDTTEEFYSYEIIFFDINLDNYEDIDIVYQNVAGVEWNSFWIFDTTSKTFLFSSDFSSLLSSYSIEDYDKKILRTVDDWYPGKKCGTIYKYRIDGLRLIQIHEEGCGTFDFESLYFYKKQLVANELKIIQLDSLFIDNNAYMRKNYNLIQDTLLLIETSWAEDTNDKFTDSSNPLIYFEIHSLFHGGLKKFTRKKVYNYTRNPDGKLLRSTTFYIVEDDKWIKKGSRSTSQME